MPCSSAMDRPTPERCDSPERGSAERSAEPMVAGSTADGRLSAHPVPPLREAIRESGRFDFDHRVGPDLPNAEPDPRPEVDRPTHATVVRRPYRLHPGAGISRVEGVGQSARAQWPGAAVGGRRNGLRQSRDRPGHCQVPAAHVPTDEEVSPWSCRPRRGCQIHPPCTTALTGEHYDRDEGAGTFHQGDGLSLAPLRE